jgi:hypothetical protein
MGAPSALIAAVALGLVVAACRLPGTASTAAPTPPASGAATAPPGPTPDLSRARFSTRSWKTDFAKASVPFDEITSGGPPRDGIPPLDRPTFETVAQADAWLKPPEPVIGLELAGEARAYPLQILTWHEIVNDEVGGTPVSVTFCPLCNTAIAFDRRLGGRVLDFGTTGNLRHSDLVMWDRQTESWWQQVSGEAIVGELTGRRLTMLPAEIVSWEEFRAGHPQGSVLSRDTGFSRSYGTNPYVGYDRVDQPPFLFQGKLDGRLPPMERVVAVEIGGEAAAYPFTLLRGRRVVHDEVGGQPVVVFHKPGTASALDQSRIADSRDVGATGVYRPAVDGRPLTFVWRDEAFVDLDTGSRWTLLGQAASGPLAGKQLEAVAHANPFWFAWAAFKSTTRVYR